MDHETPDKRRLIAVQKSTFFIQLHQNIRDLMCFMGLLGFVNNWDVVNTPDLLAQKNIPKTTNSFIGVQYTDQGTFKLKPCTGPANASAGTCTQ